MCLEFHMDHSRVKDREKLKARPKGEPYWQRIRPGCFLGFAPSRKEGDGTWHARAYDPETRRNKRRALGAFGDLPGNARFNAAKSAAEKFAEIVETGGHTSAKLDTVGDACREYAKTRSEAEQRFQRYLYDEPLAKVKLEKLRRRHLIDWRDKLQQTDSIISRSNDGKKRTRARAPATVNRDMVPVRAALSKVLAPGKPNTDAAWQEALKPIKNASRRRDLYLDRGQREKLLEKVPAEAKPFVRAMCLLPLRVGALAALTAGDFDQRTSELTISKDKAGKARRIRLPKETAKFFASQASNKLPAAPLFMRSNGAAWDKNSWKIPIAEAAKEAELPQGVCAYTLRHSTITDLVSARLPLLNIAQISGTSAEMIERHYGHLASDVATEALASLSIR